MAQHTTSHSNLRRRSSGHGRSSSSSTSTRRNKGRDMKSDDVASDINGTRGELTETLEKISQKVNPMNYYERFKGANAYAFLRRYGWSILAIGAGVGASVGWYLYDRRRSASPGVDTTGPRFNSLKTMMTNSYGRTTDMFRNSPLILGTAGFILGSVIGYAIPISRFEERFLSTASNRLMNMARTQLRTNSNLLVRSARDVASSFGLSL